MLIEFLVVFIAFGSMLDCVFNVFGLIVCTVAVDLVSWIVLFVMFDVCVAVLSWLLGFDVKLFLTLIDFSIKFTSFLLRGFD